MTFHYNNDNNTGSDFNSKIMLSAIFSLSFVILIVIILHIYARCALRLPPRQLIRARQVQHGDHVSPIKTGLDPMVINSLPSSLFKPLDGQDHDECAVCLSMFENDELARQLPNCNHIFHVHCIDTWLMSQSTCPVCRSNIMPRLAPLDREPPRGGEQVDVVVAISVSDQHEHDQRGVISKVIISNGSGASSSSSFRLNSFRKIIARERSFNSRRNQVNDELDLERQG